MTVEFKGKSPRRWLIQSLGLNLIVGLAVGALSVLSAGSFAVLSIFRWLGMSESVANVASIVTGVVCLGLVVAAIFAVREPETSQAGLSGGDQMVAIYKYQVKPGEFHVAMPRASTVVAVQMQGDDPQMWVIVDVDPGSPVMMRRFKVVATGESFDPTWRYIGTFQMSGGSGSALPTVLVFHLLEEAIA